jgi:hypothetical protein
LEERNIPFVAILYEGRRWQAATCRMQFKKGVVRVSFMRRGTVLMRSTLYRTWGMSAFVVSER